MRHAKTALLGISIHLSQSVLIAWPHCRTGGVLTYCLPQDGAYYAGSVVLTRIIVLHLSCGVCLLALLV